MRTKWLWLAVSLLVLGCSGPKLIRENPDGPFFREKQIPVFLDSALNTAAAEGPVVVKLAGPVTLTDGTQLLIDSKIRGYFITDGNKVLFAPSFGELKTDKGVQPVKINSNQTGQIAVTPSTARYMKEMGKGAAIGAGVGAVSGGLIGGLSHGWEGALIGVAAGAVAGAAVGAASSAANVWLRGDEPVTLPSGSGLIVHFEGS
ncbi:MAG: YMGG-like glycine zipper-containing protein [Pseudomonadota bacterium]